MKPQFNLSSDVNVTELDAQQLADVNGGRQVYLDGVLVEMSDSSLVALINSGAVRSVTIRGVALHNSEL